MRRWGGVVLVGAVTVLAAAAVRAWQPFRNSPRSFDTASCDGWRWPVKTLTDKRAGLVNTSSQPVSTIIVDYPDAAFGMNSLAPGKSFPYVIKPVGTGPLKVQFTNAQGVGHTANGPTLHKGDEGAIQIRLSQDSAAFF